MFNRAISLCGYSHRSARKVTFFFLRTTLGFPAVFDAFFRCLVSFGMLLVSSLDTRSCNWYNTKNLVKALSKNTKKIEQVGAGCRTGPLRTVALVIYEFLVLGMLSPPPSLLSSY